MHKLLLATTALVPLGLGPAFANPLGGQVVGGTAAIQGQGTANVTVNQTSSRAIINWTTFDIGANEKTQFVQPNSSSVALNRVTGGLGPSQIYGALSANGQVFVVNPDGILIGPGAKIDTAGFLATTHDIANTDFMAGRYNFSIPGNPSASIVNQGTITAQTGGFAALVAPGVRNSGTITARLGTVALASGNSFSLDFYGDKLITLGLTDSIAADVKDVATGESLKSLVTNEGKLKANGGTVELSAVSARRVVDSVINTSGVIEAHSIGSHNGRIVLGGPTASSKVADTPTQTIKVSGKLSVAGKRKGTTGGKITITGENIALAGARLDASGLAGGGTVLIGGNIGGGHLSSADAGIAKAALEAQLIPTAATVSVDAATQIDASAKASGDGGKVVVWSDQATSFEGSVLARGGAIAGKGGFVEVSGHDLGFNGSVDVGATSGLNGSLLLDPINATIGTAASGYSISISALQGALTSGNVIVTTGAAGSAPGDITIANSFGWTSNNNLLLAASRNIVFNSGVTVTVPGNASLNLKAGMQLDSSDVQNGVIERAVGTGVGTIIFNGSSKVQLASGGFASVFFFYDPPLGYTNPVDFSAHFVGNTLETRPIAYMWVNSLTDLQNMQNNLAGTYALANSIDASGSATLNGGSGFKTIGSIANPFTGQLIGSASRGSGADVQISGLQIQGGGDLFGATRGGPEPTFLDEIHLTGAASSTHIVGTNNGILSNSSVNGFTDAAHVVANQANGIVTNGATSPATFQTIFQPPPPANPTPTIATIVASYDIYGTGQTQLLSKTVSSAGNQAQAPSSTASASAKQDVTGILANIAGNATAYTLTTILENVLNEAVQKQLLSPSQIDGVWQFLKGAIQQNIGSGRDIGISFAESVLTDALANALQSEMVQAGYSQYLIQPTVFAVTLALNNGFAVLDPGACGGPAACAAFATISTTVGELVQVGQQAVGLWTDIDGLRARFSTLKQQAENLSQLGFQARANGQFTQASKLYAASNSTYKAMDNLRNQYTILGVSIFDAPGWTNILEVGRAIFTGQ